MADLVVLSRRARGRRLGMGGETLHRADCGHIRRSNNTHPAPADRVRLLVSLGLTCSCVDRVEAVRQIRAERAAITGEPTPPTG